MAITFHMLAVRRRLGPWKSLPVLEASRSAVAVASERVYPWAASHEACHREDVAYPDLRSGVPAMAARQTSFVEERTA